jgi:hypothetical protein
MELPLNLGTSELFQMEFYVAAVSKDVSNNIPPAVR